MEKVLCFILALITCLGMFAVYGIVQISHQTTIAYCIGRSATVEIAKECK